MRKFILRLVGQKISFLLIILIFTCSLFLLSGCSKKKEPVGKTGKPNIVVTNSWLESAVKDIAGGLVNVSSIAPPGSCPGHFDVSPKQLKVIRGSALIMRFHFQAGLDANLRGPAKDAEIVSVTAPEGLCLPDSYFSGAREIYTALSKKYPEHESVFSENLSVLKKSLDELSSELRNISRENRIIEKRVVCSVHQAVFCRWLGMEVLAEFEDIEDISVASVSKVLDAVGNRKVDFVVGNLQSNPAFARRLGERFNAEVVILSNFPSMTDSEKSFHDLVLNNIGQFTGAGSE